MQRNAIAKCDPTQYEFCSVPLSEVEEQSWGPQDVWRHQPGKYFCLSAKSNIGFRSKFFKRSEFPEVDQFIHDNRRCDLYWSVNGYSEPQRPKDCAVRGTYLYADLDEVDPRQLELRPTVAWTTSPWRYQALWRCNGTITDEIHKRFIYHIGADKDCWASNKVLRIPGTGNFKRDPVYHGRLMWTNGPCCEISDVERFVGRPQGGCDADDPPRRRRSLFTGPARPVASAEELRKRYKVKWRDTASAGDRSKAIYSIWRTMIDNGCMSLPEIMKVLEASRAWKLKIESRGEAWAAREIRKIEETMR